MDLEQAISDLHQANEEIHMAVKTNMVQQRDIK